LSEQAYYAPTLNSRDSLIRRSKKVYTYHDNGQLKSLTEYDSLERKKNHAYEFNEEGRITMVAFYKAGNLSQVFGLQRVYGLGQRIAKCEFDYYEDGRMYERRNYGWDGELVKNWTAVTRWTEKDNVWEMRHYMANGELIDSQYAITRYIYDEEGKFVKRQMLDKNEEVTGEQKRLYLDGAR
jgi:antitoxin component YwqK of YwqJK toxin-antitoxin module